MFLWRNRLNFINNRLFGIDFKKRVWINGIKIYLAKLRSTDEIDNKSS